MPDIKIDTSGYGTFGPAWLPKRQHESGADAKAAAMLGRRWLRWTVYRRTDYGTLQAIYAGRARYAWERISHHWTRRSAWRASSRLRWATQDGAGS